jgi:Flp pilus assembly pilin Flp
MRSENGATATEYAVMLSLIVLAAVGAIALTGEAVGESWSHIVKMATGG